jgi:broad specificity phosphatase PhoE
MKSSKLTVFFTRHAETESSTSDERRLSQEGRTRVESLIHVVAEAGITTIYSSPKVRAQETARPLADHLHIPVEVDNLGFEELVKKILAKQENEAILIVGHSNTIRSKKQKMGIPIFCKKIKTPLI